MTDELKIVEVDAVDCDAVTADWPFARERLDDIEACWREMLRRTPQLFDGQVLLLRRGEVEEAAGRRVFRGAYLQTRFAAFMAWRHFGWPAAGVRNGFGMAALRSSDGAFLLGEMASHTANAGRIYFASGTPDPTDIRDGKVDLEGSVRRELAEETGLDPATLTFDPGMTLVMDSVRVAFLKSVRSAEPAEALAARIEAFLARDPQPELVRMHVVRTAADIRPEMPPFCAAYMRDVLSRENPS